jgi:hypothetical protein
MFPTLLSFAHIEAEVTQSPRRSLSMTMALDCSRGPFRPGVSMIGHSGTLPLLHCAAIISSTILSFAPDFGQLLRQRFD